VDLVGALAQAIKLPNEQLTGEAINLGSGKSTSIQTLADQMVQSSGAQIKVLHTHKRGGDILHSTAKTERAAMVLGWSATTELSEGLEQMYHWRKKVAA